MMVSKNERETGQIMLVHDVASDHSQGRVFDAINVGRLGGYPLLNDRLQDKNESIEETTREADIADSTVRKR